MCNFFRFIYIYKYRYVPFGESPVPDFFLGRQLPLRTPLLRDSVILAVAGQNHTG
jgi:hypothetical protein